MRELAPAIEGHFFAVLTPSDAPAILQIEPASRRVSLWCGGKQAHAGNLADLSEVAMGQHAGDDTSQRYHFCLLYRGAEPLLLTTRTDFERRDVRAHLFFSRPRLSLSPRMRSE